MHVHVHVVSDISKIESSDESNRTGIYGLRGCKIYGTLHIDIHYATCDRELQARPGGNRTDRRELFLLFYIASRSLS